VVWLEREKRGTTDGLLFFLLHLGKHKMFPKMPDYCGDRWVMGPVALFVSYQLAAFSWGICIFTQTHLETRREMRPAGLHFYLTISRYVFTTL
jgi:hypothetical protein